MRIPPFLFAFCLCFTEGAIFAGPFMPKGSNLHTPLGCTQLVNKMCQGDPTLPYADCVATDNLTYQVDTSNYSAVINRALLGQPLNDTPLSLASCIAAAQDPTWLPLVNYPVCLNVEFQATAADPGQYSNTKNGFAFVLSSPTNYHLAASYWDDFGAVGYCPCGNFTGSSCNNDLWSPVHLSLNHPFEMTYGGSDGGGGDLGYCAVGTHGSSTGEGGFLINIFAPTGTIPATGIYTGTLTLNVGGTPC